MVVQFLLVFLAIVACPSAGIRFSNVLGDNMVALIDIINEKATFE
jgi:hypothetical protein